LCNRTITEIAFGWGFSDAAHFSRIFRARFGCAPRELRAECLRRT
jgi:AraC-like DNA-binding protein